MARRGAALALTILCAAILAAPAAAGASRPRAAEPLPAARADAIDAIVRAGMDAEHIPGLALIVLRDGKRVRHSEYGWADLERHIPVTERTAFSIGSESKQILAAGVMLLVQEGKIDLDASIARYIDEVPEAWRAITIRQLLSHTAGLAREAPGFSPDRDSPLIEVIRSAYPLPLLARPGETFDYSNLGYFIIAALISRVSGMAWQHFFEQRVFRPLGMTATRPTSPVDRDPRRAKGYDWRDGRFQAVIPYRALRPSGAFVSTPQDLARWETALVRHRLLSRQSLATMWTKARLCTGEDVPYGLGWRLEQVNGAAEIGHGGSLPGFRAYYARYPGAKLTVIVLVNGSAGAAEPRAMARAIARRVMDGER